MRKTLIYYRRHQKAINTAISTNFPLTDRYFENIWNEEQELAVEKSIFPAKNVVSVMGNTQDYD